MSKKEMTQEAKEFRLDPFTLNKQLIYWLSKSLCLWSLKEANIKYDVLRDKGLCHSDAFEMLKKKMYQEGIK